jgi:hypothetical protein
VTALWHGGATEASLEAPNDGRIEPLRVIVRDVSRDMRPLSMSVRLTMAPDDSGLQIEHLFQLANPTHLVIDTDQGAGLILPLVTPAPFGEPVESFLPQRPEPRVFRTQHNPPAGRVLVEKGRLVYRGPVTPEGAVVRVVYLLPYAGGTDHTYGLRLPLDAESVTMVVRSPERVLPRAAFRARSEVLVRGFLGGEERTARLLEKPKAGGVVLIDVIGTPDRHVFYRPLAAGLGALVVGVLVVLALSRRGRPRAA